MNDANMLTFVVVVATVALTVIGCFFQDRLKTKDLSPSAYAFSVWARDLFFACAAMGWIALLVTIIAIEVFAHS